MILGEDSEWFCPNCGTEGIATMVEHPRKGKIRIVNCLVCRREFRVEIWIP